MPEPVHARSSSRCGPSSEFDWAADGPEDADQDQLNQPAVAADPFIAIFVTPEASFFWTALLN
jgi:hypothetical protein